MENGPFIDDFPIKTFIYEGFSMAMLNYQRVRKHGAWIFFDPRTTYYIYYTLMAIGDFW
jgi:hypothetical protein